MKTCKVCGTEVENCCVRDGEPHCFGCDRKITGLVKDFVMDWKGKGMALPDLITTYQPQWQALLLDTKTFQRLVISYLGPRL